MISLWNSVDDNQRQTCERYMTSLPVRVGPLAIDLGLTVNAATLESGVSGEIKPDSTTPSGYIIRVNRHENKFRQRFTVAHEISHFLLHKDLIADGISDSILYRSSLSSNIETQANKLAADILMPYKTLKEWINQTFNRNISEADLEEISEATHVSKVALKIRLNL